MENIEISNETDFAINEEEVIRQIEHFCKVKNRNIESMSIAYVKDEQMIVVNEEYLDHEGTTDVITFDYTEEISPNLDGEIIICVDQAKRQAEDYGVSLENELSRLLFHGLLHLDGLDDQSFEERKIMHQNENLLLDSFAAANKEI